jgi:diguanylate cyclase (GGDEF)-like protein
MGGDEFVIVVPGLTHDAAMDKVGRLNECAQEASRQTPTLSGEVTLSLAVGVAFYREDGTQAEQLLAAADRRMYINKGLYYGHGAIAAARSAGLASAASVH